LQRVFEVEQAQVVFAPLAHHDRAAAVGARLRPGARTLAAKLALEVLGVSRDPYGALRLLGPDRGGREIAQGLADAGARLRQQHVRQAATRARGKHAPDIAGIAALPLAPLRARAGEPFEASLDFVRGDLDLCGLRAFGRLLPFGKLGKQPFLGAIGFGDVRQEHVGPGPAQAASDCSALHAPSRSAQSALSHVSSSAPAASWSSGGTASSLAGSGRPRACARPLGVGTTKRAGWTKA